MTEAAQTVVRRVRADRPSGLTWQAIRSARVPVSSPDRLVAELRLAQLAALLLALSAGAYIGLAVAHEARAWRRLRRRARGRIFRRRRGDAGSRSAAGAHDSCARVCGACDSRCRAPAGLAAARRRRAAVVFHWVRRVRCVHRCAVLSPHVEALIMSLRIRMFSVIVAVLTVDSRVKPRCTALRRGRRLAENPSSS